MVQNLQPSVRVGDCVLVRRQRWRIADVRACDGCTLIGLRGIGARNGGEWRQVLAPFDTVEPLERAARPRIVGPRVWRRACRTLLAAPGMPSALHTPHRCRIDLLPHQLEPALAVLRGDGCRVLIADEVGLGKTIQAALIASELRVRGAAERVLILTPAGLREQWAEELASRFHVAASIVDMRAARQRAATLPVGVNPWTTTPVAVASIDYVKRPEVLPAVLQAGWDLVIVDEAHGAAAGTDRQTAVEALCGKASYVVLLTATPHSGDERAFAALCDLGARGDELLMFRRTRRDVAAGTTRRIHQLYVRPTTAETRMHGLLKLLAQAAARGGALDRRDAWLALTVLHKRALSSAWALERSVNRRLAMLAGSWPTTGAQPLLPLVDPSGDIDDADEAPAWHCAVLDDAAEERRVLTAIAHAAGNAAKNESKIAVLRRLLQRLGRRGERAIVFTEYRDTLLHLSRELPVQTAVLHGGLTRDERRAALAGFVSGRMPVLLATDAAGEGLNLHRDCRIVINLELPWNPMRLEQRIGRVDRIGQQRHVHAVHLVARHTGEVRLLERLRERIARARLAIHAADPLDDSVEFEESSARVIVGTGPERRPAGAASAPRPVRLRAEAAAEHRRLVDARALSSAGLLADGFDGPLIARARLAGTRQRLSGRWLILYGAVLEDHAGRALGAHLTGLLLSIAPLRGGAGAAALAMAGSPPASLRAAALHRDLERWEAEATAVQQRFWDTRRRRERAIARARSACSRELQPGLFDRRAERAWAALVAQAEEEHSASRWRLSDISRAAEVYPQPPRPVLLLLP